MRAGAQAGNEIDAVTHERGAQSILVGAVAAEFVAGTGGQGSGLAFRILEAGYTMNIPRMFAALALISATGLSIHLLLSYLSHLCLRRWHETAMGRNQ